MSWTTVPAAGAPLRGVVLSSLFSEVRAIRGMNSADVTVNNSTTLVDATGMAVAVAANKTYHIVGRLEVNGNSTADFKFGFTYPSGLTMRYSALGFNTGGVYVSLDQIETSTPGFGAGGIAGVTDDVVDIVGTVFVGSTAGTLQVQFAQSTADASNTVLRGTGSYIEITERN